MNPNPHKTLALSTALALGAARIRPRQSLGTRLNTAESKRRVDAAEAKRARRRVRNLKQEATSR